MSRLVRLRDWVFASPWRSAFTSSILLYLSFFPMNWGWLGWVAIVPFLNLLTLPPSRTVYLAGWLGGLAFAVPALQWVRLASPPMYATWIALALFVSLHFLLFVWLARRMIRGAKIPPIIAAPAAWTALEYLRAHVDIGFSWYYLGHTQHDYLAVIQIADIFGAYGVSFLVVMVNVVIYQWVAGAESSKPRMTFGIRRLLPAFVTAILLASTVIYGFWQLAYVNVYHHGNHHYRGPLVALIQGNLPQDLRNDPNQKESAAEHYFRLADEAAKLKPDLIVWPETTFPGSWIRIAPEVDATRLTGEQAIWREQHAETDKVAEFISLRWGAESPIRRWGADSLIGIGSGILERDGEQSYNSAVLIDAGGRERGRYHKIFRIPFGEYLPFVDTIPWMKWLSPYDGDYSISVGKDYTIFRGGQIGDFAVLICYEDTVPHLAPRYFKRAYTGPEANAHVSVSEPSFFINISNDGWFKGSEEHEQHLVAARFRTVECRRAMARAVNMGISCVIDGNGRLVALPGKTWAESKNRTAVVLAEIPIDSRDSLYVHWGDVLPWICLIVCALGYAGASISHFRRAAKPSLTIASP